ncbi:MAG: hypothetical protein HDT32_07135, partial [Clostridiales bacterium]|nr:hypothetical protein [Clostridiales bacterium]
GIVALNTAEGLITECWFEGIRVHGNNNVGGIAGENAGTVNYCFAAATYQSGPKVRSYVGGYTNIGGIVGLTSGGTVSNCFATCNVYAYGDTAYAVASTSTNCVYLGFSFDNREEVSTSLTAPAGENNIKIAEAVAVLEKDNSSYALPATYTYKVNPEDPESEEATVDYLATLNGELTEEEQGKFSGTNGVRLADEKIDTVTVHEISVTVGGEDYKVKNTSSDVVPLGKNAAPAKEGHYLTGWSLVEKGEAVFGTKSVGYADLEELGLTSFNLYPVYTEGEDPYDRILSVAVYKQYVDEEIIASLIEAFKTYCTENGIEVNEFNYTMVGNSNTSVTSFCNTVKAGDFNIMLGQRANLTITVTGNTDTMLKVNGTARRIAKIFDEPEGTAAYEFYNFVLNADAAKKILDPTYITEAEADKIEVTLLNGEMQHGDKLTVSNATGAKKVTLPTLTAADGYNFAGWALTAEAAEDEVLLSGSVGYADLVNYAEGGKLTLYARFTEIPQIPTVVIAIHSSASSSTYITTEEIEKIKTGFENYIKSKGYTTYDIDWYVVTGKNSGGFDTAVKGYDKTVNVAVGAKAMGLDFDTEKEKVLVGSGIFANTSRYVGVLDGSGDNKLAGLFYEYMTTAQ